ncbi:MAG: periplasmic heavy metal sensor [Polyangiaceae bacterium]|nr:periplasmic heavy metal sensor [Polyangiaceae bacterium]
MFGIIVGTVCLVWLIKVVGCRYGCGGCGYRSGCGGPHWGHRHGFRGFGRRWALRWLFERLGTMPGQERAILEALDRLSESRSMLRAELKQTRAEVARAIESGLVDDSTLEETFARHDRALAQLRVSIVEALKTTTETLDERQRRELAAVIARGGLWGRGDFSGPAGSDPYRT